MGTSQLTKEPPESADGTDTRTPAVRDLHASLAELHFKTEKARLKDAVAAAGETVPASVQASIEATGSIKYSAQTAFGGLLFMTVNTVIDDYVIACIGGGLGFGGALTWGSAWLNFPIGDMVGWQCRFQANVSPAVVNVNWWGMHGEHIGSFVGGGVALAAGVFGGEGKIKRS